MLTLPFLIYDQIQLGPVTLYTWSLFLGLAFIFGFFIVRGEAKNKKVDESLIVNLSLIILFSSLFGSHLAYLIQKPIYFFSYPLEIFHITRGGLAIYGGILFSWLASWIYLKRLKFDFPLIADLFAPALALGIAVGRLGCFLINEHQGTITRLPWAIVWPDGSLRHPISLYLAFAAFFIFCVLWYLRGRIKSPGRLFLTFLILYSASIFFLDFLRVDPHYFGLSGNQLVSIGILLGLVIRFKPKFL